MKIKSIVSSPKSVTVTVTKIIGYDTKRWHRIQKEIVEIRLKDVKN